MASLRWIAGRALDASAWRPENLSLLVAQRIHLRRNANARASETDHLVAAAAWLERAQDAASDGGVSGRYHIAHGWSSSYPETTGYIIPTFLALAEVLGDERWVERARRCVDFLLPLQLAEGGFPGGELHENRARPSVFNTAQIVSGLTAWHAATGDAPALAAALRSADWLLARQDADGAWRTDIYNDLPTTYTAFASCWLAELGRHVGEERYLKAAERHLDWVLAQRDETTGWMDACGFTEADHAGRRGVLHTIAYTLAGMLRTAEIVGRRDGLSAVRAAADGIARRLELSGWLPGVLDHRWRGAAGYSCLTGNAQMALVWLRLFELEGEAHHLNVALRALDSVRAAQPLSRGGPGVRGGIAGSHPVWGDYLYMSYPNWAAKFFIDALIEKRRVLGMLGVRDRPSHPLPFDVPTSLPAVATSAVGASPRIVLYGSPGSAKVEQMVRAFGEWGGTVSAVVVERGTEPALLARVSRRVREDGLRGAADRFFARRRGAPDACPAPDVWRPSDVTAFCAAAGIPVIEVASLSDENALDAVRALAPDVAIHAGAGILRAPLLGIPRLGTLNAHMGLLPHYRGMHVAEWARLQGDSPGCTVHLVDPGIDTGDILCARVVDTGPARSVAEMRALVDRAQIALLSEVVRYIARTGALPPRRPQESAEGRQYFRMHPALASMLDDALRRAAPAGAPA